jgi:hypothetical protein
MPMLKASGSLIVAAVGQKPRQKPESKEKEDQEMEE